MRLRRIELEPTYPNQYISYSTYRADNKSTEEIKEVASKVTFWLFSRLGSQESCIQHETRVLLINVNTEILMKKIRMDLSLSVSSIPPLISPLNSTPLLRFSLALNSQDAWVVDGHFNERSSATAPGKCRSISFSHYSLKKKRNYNNALSRKTISH